VRSVANASGAAMCEPVCWSERHKMRRGYNGSTPVMYCRDCKGSGASLTRHCAVRQLTDAEEAAIAAGTIDFVNGEWLTAAGVTLADSEVRR
jgi:hypothetical protein